MQQQIPLDAAVANRFISSLSKSLQALCHGCMDFENGIEIVGFINVNIDSGSKVDYVLNEKVQKSTNNSMTFVSNSFLATKKDQPKPTRDESCSPVPELMNTFPSNQQTSSYQYPHQRENLYSPTKPQSLRGKRSWSGADRPSRGTPQKQSRGGGRVSVTHGNSYNNTPSASAPSSEFLTTHHQQNDTPVVSHSGDNNVKQEPFDNEFAASGSGIIKGDPDASPEASSATGQTDNFLSKSSEADPNNAQGDQLPVSFSADNPYESSESRDNDQSFMSVAGPSHQAQSHSEPDYDRGEFDDQEEQEGDVIEIGDDDEDINEMFGHSGNNDITHFITGKQLKGHPDLAELVDLPQDQVSTEIAFIDLKFNKGYKTALGHNSHFQTHETEMPFICTKCNKGYMTALGLNLHFQTHEGTFFACPICDAKFTQKGSVGRHVKSKHKSAYCRSCFTLLKLGPDYDKHVLHCK